MKKYKVKLTNPNSSYHEFDDGTAIGINSGAEPTELVLFLDDNEHKTLLLWLQNDHNDAGMALYHFLESFTCSKWHRRIIRATFDVITNIKIEFFRQ